jgi:hypothetical protein
VAVRHALNLYTAEISAERWLALFKARRWCPLLRLSASAWLRLLLLRPLCHEPRRICCPYCGINEHPLADPTWHRVCLRCDHYALPLDDTFWRDVSDRLKRAWYQDRTMIARIKQEWKDGPVPVFEGPLRWITEVWRLAPRRRGTPPADGRRTLVGVWMEFLTKPCVRVHADTDTHLRFEEVPSLLSQRRAIQTLQGDIPEEDRIFQTDGGRPVIFGALSTKELHAITQAFQAGAGRLFGKAIELEEREARRALRWLERQTLLSVVMDGPTPRRPRNSPSASPADRSPRGGEEAQDMFDEGMGEVDGSAGA